MKSVGLTSAAAACGVLLVLVLNAVRPALTHRLVDFSLRPLPERFRARIAKLVYGLLDGLAVTRDPRRLAQAVALSYPLWMSIATGIWLATAAFHMTIPFTGSFLIMALLVVGVAAPTPGAVGGFHEMFRLGTAVFYGVDEQSGGRGGHRPPCRLVRAGHAAGGTVHDAGRAQPGQGAQIERRGRRAESAAPLDAGAPGSGAAGG